MTFFQRFNRRIGAWIIFRVLRNGKTVIVNQKTRQPLIPFKGIPRKR